MSTPDLNFMFAFLFLVFVVMYLDMKFSLLRDTSTASTKPYSFARVQLAWWLVIIVASITAIMLLPGSHFLPLFDQSTWALLGISAATMAGGSVIDASDNKNPTPNHPLARNLTSENLILDILSDSSGVTIHRLQTVVFNLLYGVWFVYKVLNNLGQVGSVIPAFDNNTLILLGLSSGTYAALKSTENK